MAAHSTTGNPTTCNVPAKWNDVVPVRGRPTLITIAALASCMATTANAATTGAKRSGELPMQKEWPTDRRRQKGEALIAKKRCTCLGVLFLTLPRNEAPS